MPVNYVQRPDCNYFHDYEEIFSYLDRRAGEVGDAQAMEIKRQHYRSLILDDLFFIVLFVMEIEKANHPFVVDRCFDVQTGPRTDTIDIWARYHFKSVIITQAETIQYHLKHPEHCTGIHAYARPLAKAFLRSIKTTCETSELLRFAFSDILWQNPQAQSPKWSEDEGLVFIRNSSSRKESTIEAWGLVEGQPTGRHFERNIFEDLETEDIRESPEMLEKVFSRFQMAGNLGTGSDSDINRIIGTYYSHFGPNVRIGDMVYPGTDKKIYNLRIFPGSDDGTATGKPVLVGPETWEKLKASQHFHSQQLCNPTPKTEIKLPYNLLIPIDPKNMPKNRLKFLIIDPAGDDDVQSGKHNDSWAIGCISVKPDMDELGNSDIFIEDCECDTFGLGDDGGSAVDAVVNMHLRNGRITGIGVEKVATDSSYKHIQNGLKAKHKKAIIKKTQRDNGNIVLLTPAGKTKARKIETSLSYPWYNGKIHISTRLAQRILDKIKEECDKFPYYHVDILDMISYIYQLLDALKFNFQLEEDEDEEEFHKEQPPQRLRSAICGY
jgi:hypothetical protein